MPVNEITVWFENDKAETFDSYHSGITEVPYRLYIYINPQRTEVLYINLDKVQCYSIKNGD